MEIGVKNRHSCVDNEKCPKCLGIYQHFMDLEDGLLGCFVCGCVFVSKPVRDEVWKTVPAIVRQHQIEAQQAKIAAENKTLCDCGFEAKNKAGLLAHQRKCKKAA